MTRFFDFLINSNLFISACALCLYLFYSIQMEVNFFISTPILVFALTYMAYHLLRFIPLQKGFVIDGNLKNFYQKHKWFFAISLPVKVVSILYGLYNLERLSLTLLIIAGILVLFYERIFIPRFELRSVPYLKSFVIGLVWAVIATSLNGEFNPALFIECFIFITLLAIPFDIKDLDFDTKNKIKTLPMLLGEKLTPILGILYLVYALIVFYYTRELFLLISPLVYWGLLIQSKKYERLYYLGFDGLILGRFIAYFL